MLAEVYGSNSDGAFTVTEVTVWWDATFANIEYMVLKNTGYGISLDYA